MGELRRDFLTPRGREVGDRDTGACGEEGACRGEPNAGCAAGDDDGLFGEVGEAGVFCRHSWSSTILLVYKLSRRCLYLVCTDCQQRQALSAMKGFPEVQNTGLKRCGSKVECIEGRASRGEK